MIGGVVAEIVCDDIGVREPQRIWPKAEVCPAVDLICDFARIVLHGSRNIVRCEHLRWSVLGITGRIVGLTLLQLQQCYNDAERALTVSRLLDIHTEQPRTTD
eukprot:4752862-Pleurochrysis_carterae.AAC.1